MNEGFAVISGKVSDIYSKDLEFISNIAKNRYSSFKTANHEWINSVENSEYRSALERVRASPDIINKISDKFNTKNIKNVTETDEIYWAVSPKNATGSDRSLVDCHYDSPFAWFPTGGVIYYRVIIACNENNTVITIFPDEEMRVKMSTSYFHGLDYNKDWHCVEGKIPEGKYRVLLKLHYLVTPEGSEFWEEYVKYINIQWTVLSRETMRMSANPKNILEYIIAGTVTFCRIIFNYFYVFIFTFIFLAIIYYNRKYIINTLGISNRKSKIRMLYS